MTLVPRSDIEESKYGVCLGKARRTDMLNAESTITRSRSSRGCFWRAD
jgi:hypothetical protein